ncbi:MAG: hypothetical protein OEY23_02775 [Acidimicrobiia bacterium]|nr:hypothetical protein [Acidimicrobiia bacterium]
MSAPDFVPARPTDKVRLYSSPPRRAGSWLATRPGELGGDGQPSGARLGSQGPDQGFVFKLVGRFADRLSLDPAEDRRDVIAGCVAVALKRASLFGRAPVVHDLTAAFGVFGFLSTDPPSDLVRYRQGLFDGVGHPHHQAARRAVADAVPVEVLRQVPTAIVAGAAKDWQSQLVIEHTTAH